MEIDCESGRCIGQGEDHIYVELPAVISLTLKGRFTHSMRADAVPMPCHAAKGLECVFPI